MSSAAASQASLRSSLAKWIKHAAAGAGFQVAESVCLYLRSVCTPSRVTIKQKMAQAPEFNLRKPSAYNYDFALLGVITAAFGLLGLPPINGVLPQVNCQFHASQPCIHVPAMHPCAGNHRLTLWLLAALHQLSCHGRSMLTHYRRPPCLLCTAHISAGGWGNEESR